MGIFVQMMVFNSKTFVMVTLGLVIGLGAKAGLVTVQNIDDSGLSAYGLYSNQGSLVPASSDAKIEAGAFNLSNTAIITAFETGDIDTLNAAFTPFGEEVPVNVVDGVFQGQVMQDSTAFVGQPIALWIRGSNLDDQSQEQHLIFIANAQFQPEVWVDGQVILSDASGTLLVGAFGKYATDFGFGGSVRPGFNLVPVPDTNDDDSGAGDSDSSGNPGNGSDTDNDDSNDTEDPIDDNNDATDGEPTGTLPTALLNAQPFGSNFYFSDWLGGFFTLDGDPAFNNFLYTMDFGWISLSPDSTENDSWMYSFSLDGWLWGGQSTGRFFYYNSANAWIFVVSEPTGGSFAWNTSTEEWFYISQ